MKGDAVIGLMLAALDEAFNRKSWHGTNLRGSLRSLTVDQAAWRPGKGRHNIWEIVVHTAYWKYAVRRAITGEKRGSFPYKGSNWFARDGTDGTEWRRDLKLFDNEHRQLRAAVAGFDPRKLGESSGRRFTYASLIRGIAAHDLYHAGQIQLLKRMQKGT
jgi:uncharacterized damage-inducible protein DinB